jgi:hypothetical protein
MAPGKTMILPSEAITPDMGPPMVNGFRVPEEFAVALDSEPTEFACCEDVPPAVVKVTEVLVASGVPPGEASVETPNRYDGSAIIPPVGANEKVCETV